MIFNVVLSNKDYTESQLSLLLPFLAPFSFFTVKKDLEKRNNDLEKQQKIG